MTIKYNLGFIGGSCESIAGYPHYISSRMDGLFEIVAGAFSTHPEINKKTAEKWGVPDIYDDWRMMLKEEKNRLDAVVVLLPTPMHCDAVTESLKAGFPVICEKPLTASMEEMSILAETYNPEKHFLAVINNYSGYPMVRELRERIQKNDLGKIHLISLEMPQESFLRPPKSIKYPQKWRLQDGFVPMIALDLGTHLYHLAEFLVHEVPSEVWGEINSFSPYPVIDDMRIQARYASGIRGDFWMSKVALGNRNGLCIKIFGSEGSALWHQETPEKLEISRTNGSKSTLDRGGEMTMPGNPLINRMTPGHPAGFIEAMANLYSDIHENLHAFLTDKEQISPYVFGYDHALEAMKFLHNARHSADTGVWIKNQ